MKRVAAGVCLVLCAAVAGVWVYGGMHMATRTEIPVVTVATDDFGDEVKTTAWKQGFELGLLDGALPAGGALLGLAGLLLVLDWRGRRRPTSP